MKRKSTVLTVALVGVLVTQSLSYADDEDWQPDKNKPLATFRMIGTEGHGKPALASAMTRVQAAKGMANFISIQMIESEPAYRRRMGERPISTVEFETAQRRYLLIDAPALRDASRGLISKRVDGTILVVSAVEGPELQTCELIRLAREVGDSLAAVYLSQCDKADEEGRRRVEAEVRDLLVSFGVGDEIPVICGDASGKGDREIEKLLAVLDQHELRSVPGIEGDFLMKIEDVFSVSGETVVIGRIDRGVVKAEDEVEISGLGKSFDKVVQRVEKYRRRIEQGKAGDHVGVVLRDTRRDEVHQGQVIAKPGSITVHAKFRSEVFFLDEQERGYPISLEDGVLLYFDPALERGSIQQFPPKGGSASTTRPGDQVRWTVELEKSLFLEKGESFLILNGMDTVGAGVVTEILD